MASPLLIKCPPIFILSHHHHRQSSLYFSKTFSAKRRFSSSSIKMEGSEIQQELTEIKEVDLNGRKKIFVAGATGSTGKRIVEQLLSRGFAVKAGVRDLDKAKKSLPKDNPSLQIVKADVTEGSAKLADAIGDDSEAVVCATGFRPGWDLFAPWKVDNFGTVNLVEACRKQAENHIRKSGVNYTIIRPGGLRNDPPSGNVVMEPEDKLYEGTISRDQVAEVAVEALVNPESSFKVVEIVSRVDAPKTSYKDLFGSITQR